MIQMPSLILVELKPSRIHEGGVGVFALRRIMGGQKIAEGVGDADYRNLVSWSTLENYEADIRERIMNLTIGTPDGFMPPPNFDFNNLPFPYYFNHSCEGNCGFNDIGNFVAIRDIEKGEEVTSDYGLAESNPAFIMQCTCGSTFCRNTITGNDWKDSEFRSAHLEYMLPRLRLNDFE